LCDVDFGHEFWTRPGPVARRLRPVSQKQTILRCPYLATDPAAAGLRNRVEVLAGSGVLSDRSRRELGEVAYLLRALNPKGDR
jgi:hypothetical protein